MNFFRYSGHMMDKLFFPFTNRHDYNIFIEGPYKTATVARTVGPFINLLLTKVQQRDKENKKLYDFKQ